MSKFMQNFVLIKINKNYLRTIIPPSIWDFGRYLKFLIFKNSNFAAHNMDRKLQKYLNYNYGFFVDVGANDGFTESNTLFLERKRNWRGVLIEPAPNQFINCCYYRGRKGNSFFPNACVSFECKKKIMQLKYANLMSVLVNKKNTLKSIDDHLISGRQHIIQGTDKLEFGVYVKTLNKILNESKAPQIIDLMSIDVEGSEMEVLKGINFKQYKFKYILIECRNFKKINNFLIKKNYKFIEKLSIYDYLFAFNIKKNPLYNNYNFLGKKL